MKERPILFSSTMVKAILENRKSQTRRVVSPSNAFWGSASKEFWNHADFSRAWVDGGKGGAQYLHVRCHVDKEGSCTVCDDHGWPDTSHRLWSRIAPATDGRVIYADNEKDKPASRLWVKETWANFGGDEDLYMQHKPGVAFRATWDSDRSSWPPFAHHIGYVPGDKWRPSIFMPRWASRITLDISSVRVQRLQEISFEDAKAEGCNPPEVRQFSLFGADAAERKKIYDIHARLGFQPLWDSINAKTNPWDSNPWVWAISFVRLKQ